MIYFVRTYEFMCTDLSTITPNGYKRHVNMLPFKKEDTYVAIFASFQQKDLNILLSCKELNILYQAPAAKNSTPGHKDSRNTLVIFEKA